MTGAELERALHHMPAVAERATNTWAAGFARSILRQSRRKGWKPTPKQSEIIRRLVAELFADAGDDAPVIEVER